MGQQKQVLSAQDRLTLIQTLNALPRPQFDELAFALNPPHGNIPDSSAPQGDRSQALLIWAESPIGPGLSDIEEMLSQIIGKSYKTSEEILKFKIAGKLGDINIAELETIVAILRRKTGDDTIEIIFSQEGSVDLILSGSDEGLKKLQELFESGDLEGLKQQVMQVEEIDKNTTEARKNRLITVIKHFDSGRGRFRLRVINKRVMIHKQKYPITIILTIVFSNFFLIAGASEIISITASAMGMAITMAIGTTIEIKRQIAIRRNHPILQRTLVLNRVFEHELDLRNADLSGADLREFDFSGVNLKNANVTKAIFGKNKGLTKKAKQYLVSRGAIFVDPLDLDEADLLLRESS